MNQLNVARASFLAGSAAFASIAFVRSPARAAEVTWKLGFVSKAEHPVGVHSIEMAKNVLRESNGRFEIQVFPNSTLINDGDAIQMTRSNAVQMMIPIGSTLSSIVPIAAIEGIGFTFTTQEQALRAFDGALGDEIRRQISTTGLHPFKKVWVNGFRQVTTNSRSRLQATSMGCGCARPSRRSGSTSSTRSVLRRRRSKLPICTPRCKPTWSTDRKRRLP